MSLSVSEERDYYKTGWCSMKIFYCITSLIASVICGVAIANDDKLRMTLYGIYAFSLATNFIIECNRDKIYDDMDGDDDE
jgi:hypothetical protein